MYNWTRFDRRMRLIVPRSRFSAREMLRLSGIGGGSPVLGLALPLRPNRSSLRAPQGCAPGQTKDNQQPNAKAKRGHFYRAKQGDVSIEV